MLILALIVSSGLLILANWAVQKSDRAVAVIFFSGLICAIGPNFCMFFLPPVALQAFGLFVAALIWDWTRWGRRPRTFLTLSLLATAIPYAVLGWNAWQDFGELQRRYAYASLEDRLRVTAPASLTLPRATSDRLDQLEEKIAEQEDFFSCRRTAKLRDLHERAVIVFINRPGFGIGRFLDPLHLGLRDRDPGRSLPEQRGPRSADLSTDLIATGFTYSDPPVFLHRDAVVDFVNAKGFGFFKDRRHVAGFQPHQFSQFPTSGDLADPWLLATLDLVGLVVHEKPAVYISDRLPQMEKLASVPTRAPDEFEDKGLEKLRQGEDFFVRESDKVRRMLGAVRSARQCLTCHEGPRGTLLGAFSYTFVKPQRTK